MESYSDLCGEKAKNHFILPCLHFPGAKPKEAVQSSPNNDKREKLDVAQEGEPSNVAKPENGKAEIHLLFFLWRFDASHLTFL